MLKFNEKFTEHKMFESPYYFSSDMRSSKHRILAQRVPPNNVTCNSI